MQELDLGRNVVEVLQNGGDGPITLDFVGM